MAGTLKDPKKFLQAKIEHANAAKTKKAERTTHPSPEFLAAQHQMVATLVSAQAAWSNYTIVNAVIEDVLLWREDDSYNVLHSSFQHVAAENYEELAAIQATLSAAVQSLGKAVEARLAFRRKNGTWKNDTGWELACSNVGGYPQTTVGGKQLLLADADVALVSEINSYARAVIETCAVADARLEDLYQALRNS